MTIASSSNTKTSKHSHSNSITQTTSHSLLKSDSDIDDESDDSGSLEGESEDEWAEERKMSRYIAESELEDNLSSDDDDEINSNLQAVGKSDPTQLSMGALLKAQRQQQSKGSSKTLIKQVSRPITDHESESDTLPSSRQARISSHSTSKPEQETSHRSDHDTEANALPSGPVRKLIPHRTNKHAPMVMSSKRSVTRRRTVVEVPKLERRDPRFDSLSGAVDPELHARSYGFLRQQRQAEIDDLSRALKQAKANPSFPTAEFQRMEEALHRAENAEVQRHKLEREHQALKAWKTTEKAQQQEGKSAFYLKKKDQKDVILADRFQHLSQDKRKLHKSMERKRKKVAGKEKKSMPAKRSRSDGAQ